MHLKFYLFFTLLAVVTTIAAVTWNRWYIRHLLRKEFQRQLQLEAEGVQTILKPTWRRY